MYGHFSIMIMQFLKEIFLLRTQNAVFKKEKMEKERDLMRKHRITVSFVS